MAENFERKNLFQLTLPLFLFGIMTIGVTFADTMMLANYSDDLAASVSMANQVLGLGYDLSGLMSVGALILIAQFLGRNEVDNARDIARVGFCASVGFGVIIAVGLGGGATYYTDWINTPDEIRGDVLIYIYSISLTMVYYGFINTAIAALRGFGRTMEILWLGIIGNVAYLAAEYAFVYGFWIIPEMGIYGAALSTVLIRSLKLLLLIWFLQYRIGLTIFPLPRNVWSNSIRILKLSYPSVGEALGYQLYQLVIVSLIAGLGVTAILTRSYTLTITQLLAMIVIVISYGNEVLVGYDKGAGDNETAFRRAVKNAVMTGIAVTGIAAGLWLGGEFLIGLFTQDAAVVAAVQTILMLHIIVTPFQTVNLILFNSLKAAGDVNRPVIVNLSITFALALPLVWLFADYLGYGVEGLWYALILEEMAKGTAMFLLWRYRSWQRLKLVEDTDGKSSYAV
ncbi:MAG: MATE family efflux transporter [Alphaproteobacteria bacterium]|nr:MATE family efflux transporter [Alphaproteobacteria bacterium]MBO6863799.1 MATE family efflux transporter [Alphaproteobacteria bacterium]